MSAGGKPDGSIKISIEGDAKNLEEALKKFEKQADTSGKKAKTSIGSVNAETNTLKNSLGILKTAGEKSFSALETAGKKAFNGIKSAGNIAMGTITATVTAAAGAVSGLAVKSIDLANDLTEVQNVVDSTFGKNADKINTWAQNASKAYGLSELSAKQYNGTLGAMLKSMGITGESMVKMSTDLTGLAGDMASFYNLDSEVAFEKIRSGISGETEPLKQLGINMSVANLEAFALSKGIDKAYDSMTQAEQATLRYQYIMNATKDAQGDFAKTFGDSLANQLRVAKLNLTDLSGTIGKDLLPMAQKYVSMLSGYAEDLKRAYSKDGFNGMIAEGGHIVSELISEVAKQAPKAINFGFSLVDNIIDGISQNSGKLTSTALEIISKLTNGIKNTVSNLQPLIGDFANVFVQGVIKYKDVFWTVAFDMVTAIADGLSKNANSITDGVVTLVSHIAKLTIDNLPKLVETASNLIVTVFRKLEQSMPDIGGNLSRIITKICSLLATNIPIVLQAASDLIITVFNMLAQNLPNISSNLAEMLTKICDLVVKNLPLIFNTASDLIVNIFYMLAQNMPDIAKNLTKMITKICDLLAKNLPLIIEAASEFLEAFIEELLGHADEIWDGIKNIISSLFDSFGKLTPKVETIAKILGGMLALKGVSAFLRTIDKIEGAISGLFGLVKNHPIGAAVGIGVALIGSLSSRVSAAYQDAREENSKLSREENALSKKIDEAAQSFDDFKTSKDNAVKESTGEWDYYQLLTDKLDGLVECNGKIKSGQEDVVKGITEDLTNATGIEFEFKDGMIDHYELTRQKIDEVIQKQKALALQSTLGEINTQAELDLSNHASNYALAEEQLNSQKKVVSDSEKEFNQFKSEHSSYNFEERGLGAPNIPNNLLNQYDKLKGNLDGAKEKLNELQSDYDEAEKMYFETKQTVDEYDTLSTAIARGNLDTINNIVKNISNNFIEAKNGTLATMKDQVDRAKNNFQALQSGFNKGLQGITSEQVSNAKDFVKQTEAELAKFNMNSVVKEYKSAKDMSSDELTELRDKASNSLTELKMLYDEKSPYITESMIDETQRLINGVDARMLSMNYNTEKKSEELSNSYAKGISNGKERASKAATEIKTATEQGLSSNNTYSIGENFIDGFVNGIMAKLQSGDIFGAAAEAAQSGLNAMVSVLDIHSPSKASAKIADFFIQGYINKIKTRKKEVSKESKEIASISLSGLSTETPTDHLNPLVLSPTAILSAQQTARNIESRAASSVTTTNIHNITTNNDYAEYQKSGEGYVEECRISFERGINDLVEFLAPKIETRMRRRGTKAVKKIG